MHRNLTPHTWMYRNRHPIGKCTDTITLTHECTEIIIPQVNTPESYPSHMNAPRLSSLMRMHRYPTPYTWMHRRHHPSSKCTGIVPLTHECTEIVTLQVNATIAYPSHMNAPKSFIPQVNAPISYPSQMNAPKIVTSQVNAQTIVTSQVNAQTFCIDILPLIHKNTKIIIPQVNAKEFPSHMNAPKSSSLRCTGISPLTHECTEIVTPRVNAPISYPSHMNAPKSSSLK